MEYYRSIISKITSKKVPAVTKSSSKTSTRAVRKLENTYFFVVESHVINVKSPIMTMAIICIIT